MALIPKNYSRSYLYACGNSAEDERLGIYRVSEGKK
jgi:hypothetical protein